MRQSLFDDDAGSAGPFEALRGFEARLQRTSMLALAAGTLAVLLASIALVVALLR